MLPKKIVRIINNAGFNYHTNELFLKSKIIKFHDLVQFKTATIMYKAKNKLLPANIQHLFDTKEDLNYNLRGKNKFSAKYARTKTKTMCVSVVGVKILIILIITLQRLSHYKNLKKCIRVTYSIVIIPR